MHDKVYFYFGLCVLLFIGCSDDRNHVIKPGEGMVTYNISYPDSNKYGMKAAFFPKMITLVFKDEKAAFIATGGFGMVQIVDLLDHKNRKFTSLLIDNIRENFGCKLTPEEIKKNENSSDYHFESTNETKEIAGIKCRKAIVNDLTNKTTFEIFYDDHTKFYYWNSPFKDFNHLFLEYTHTINSLTMKLTAIKIDLTTPVDTTLFNVKGNYRWVNQDEFFNRLNKL